MHLFLPILLACVATTAYGADIGAASPSEGSPRKSAESCDALDGKLSRLENLIAGSHPASYARVKAEWAELTSFHRELWRTMALDPGTLPVREVPEALQSKNLSEELERRFEDLSNSVLIQKYGLEEPFAEYVDVVSQILALRREQKFVAARSLAKRGLLDDAYLHLTHALEVAQQTDEALVLPIMSSETERELLETLASLRDSPKIPALTAAGVNQVPALSTKADEGGLVPVKSQTSPNKTHSTAVESFQSPAPAGVTSHPRPIANVLWAMLGFVLALPVGALLYRAVILDPGDSETEAGLKGLRGWPTDFDFAQWLEGYRELIREYRQFRTESDQTLRQTQPFLEDSSRFFKKFYQETRESHYRAGFTDLELAMSDLITGLSGSLQGSDQHCRALMNHLSLLADAIRGHASSAKTNVTPRPPAKPRGIPPSPPTAGGARPEPRPFRVISGKEKKWGRKSAAA